MAGGRVSELAARRIEQHRQDRREERAVHTGREPIERGQDRARLRHRERECSPRAPDLTHRGRRLQAVTGDVTDGERDRAIRSIDDVVPVAAASTRSPGGSARRPRR